MLDLFHVPGVGHVGNSSQDVFIGPAGVFVAGELVWTKPRGKSMCHVFILGSGGGGGGGASGSQISVVMPLWAMPEFMVVEIYSPGLGGASGNAGGAALSPTLYDASTRVGVFSAANSQGGAAGAATGNAAGASSNGGLTQGYMFGFAGNLIVSGPAQGGGATGGLATTGAAGTNITYPVNGLCVTGGAGGGAIGTTGNGGAGGSIGASNFWGSPSISGGIASSGAGGNGSAGISWPFGIDQRMVNTGGGGGAGSAFNSATTGGNGGNGGYGCGGGGGGACLTGGVGGKGGDGGPGIVIITCW